jgi:hypothetical protein
MELELTVLVALGAVGMLAGFVDAIAGGRRADRRAGAALGGGAAGRRLRHQQGAVGDRHRHGGLHLLAQGFRLAARAGPAGGPAPFSAPSRGGRGQAIDTSILSYAVPVALIGSRCTFPSRPGSPTRIATRGCAFSVFVPVMGFAIGFYDGIFGPGTGSFLTMGFVISVRARLTRRPATPRCSTSPPTSVRWRCSCRPAMWCGAPPCAMAIGQIVGGYLGALHRHPLRRPADPAAGGDRLDHPGAALLVFR